MSVRIVVSPACTRRCPSCEACEEEIVAPDEGEVLGVGSPEIVLGGGDATLWQRLEACLTANAASSSRKRIWVEAPLSVWSCSALGRLARLGAIGVVIQVEAGGAALGVVADDGPIKEAEALGLEVRVRLRAGPRSFSMVVPIARRLAPRPVTLEVHRLGAGGKRAFLRPDAIDHAFRGAPNLTFEHHRMEGRGFLPPCALPALYAARPEVFRTLLSRKSERPNDALEVCFRCDLARRCRFSDVGALRPATRRRVVPVEPRRPRGGGFSSRPVPSAISELRKGPPIPCVAPWMMMEIVDPVGLVNHCCADWTVGSRGNARVRSLDELWNGPVFRAARRRMLKADPGPLCRPICPRLADGRFSEDELRILDRSPLFVENQLLLAEDLALRRDTVRAKPLYMTLCPTTYCNYDCIMCAYGRLPRRDLPRHVLEQVVEYLPTLRTLTLLGGEPFASPAVMELLARFDRERYPDGGVDVVTNGSLLTPRALENLGGCAFGNVVISVNAGTPEDYERVHGGARMAPVLENIDALLAHRERYGHFGVTLSFVVQPAASSGLVRFGELAIERGLDIRLLPLTPSSNDLDFYGDERIVSRVLSDLDDLLSFAKERKPTWLAEIEATREAIERTAKERASRRGGGPLSGLCAVKAGGGKESGDQTLTADG